MNTARKISTRLAIAIIAVICIVGGIQDAHAATTRTAPVVYGTQGNPGFSDPRSRPVSMVFEQGTIKIRKAAWKWGTTSATTKRAQEKECSSTGCTPWIKVIVHFYDVKSHRVKNLGGGYVTLKFFSKVKVTVSADPYWLFFVKDPKVMQWMTPACSNHQSC